MAERGAVRAARLCSHVIWLGFWGVLVSTGEIEGQADDRAAWPAITAPTDDVWLAQPYQGTTPAAEALAQKDRTRPSMSPSQSHTFVPNDTFFQEEVRVSPGGAFLRSLLLPGWGHVATGAPGRGAFYVAAQSGGLWMLWKSVTQRGAARRATDFAREITIERLESQGITEPELSGLADQDPAVAGWEEVLESRDQQVEDWVALSLFLGLVGAADAYVTAHLRDFPEPLALRAGPDPFTGGFQVEISIPVGGGTRASAY